MAGSTHAYFYHMFSGRPQPELGIESGYADDFSRSNTGMFTHMAQCFLGKVVQLLLNGLKDGNQRFFSFPFSAMIRSTIRLVFSIPSLFRPDTP